MSSNGMDAVYARAEDGVRLVKRGGHVTKLGKPYVVATLEAGQSIKLRVDSSADGGKLLLCDAFSEMPPWFLSGIDADTWQKIRAGIAYSRLTAWIDVTKEPSVPMIFDENWGYQLCGTGSLLQTTLRINDPGGTVAGFAPVTRELGVVGELSAFVRA